MNTKNISIAAMAAFLILGMTAMAFAAPGQGRNGRGAGLNSKGVYSQLTPEKQKAVDAIYDKYDGKFDSLRTQLWTKHSTLQALINGGNADEKKIGGLIADINELRDQMRDTREAMRADLEKETGWSVSVPASARAVEWAWVPTRGAVRAWAISGATARASTAVPARAWASTRAVATLPVPAGIKMYFR